MPRGGASRGSFFGLFERAAVYREGLGCTICNGVPSADVARGVDRDRLDRAMDRAFEEIDPERPMRTRAVVVAHRGRIIALTYLRLLELWMERAGLPLTVDRIMDRMRTLNSCLCWNSRARKPRRLESCPEGACSIARAIRSLVCYPTRQVVNRLRFKWKAQARSPHLYVF